MAFAPWLVIILASLFVTGCEQVGPNLAKSPPVATESEYRLGVGDIISVRVYGGEEELRFDRIRINAPGIMTFPFGEFKAPGRTTRELETGMTEAMRGKFLLNPKVWINIEEYRSFYVQGQVGRPGAFPYQPGLNVNKAVTIAGGFRERASKQKMFLLREDDKTNTPILVDLNYPVGPGDTVTVEESFF